MKRGKPLQSDPEKARAWQARGVARARERRQDAPQTRSKNVKPRRNDSAWRREVELKRGRYCRACLTTEWLQADHIKNRSQGGPSVVENGIMLCQRHHQMITECKIKYEPEWFDEDQITWLKGIGWVWWDDDGYPCGPGRRGFARHVRRAAYSTDGFGGTVPPDEEKGGRA